MMRRPEVAGGADTAARGASEQGSTIGDEEDDDHRGQPSFVSPRGGPVNAGRSVIRPGGNNHRSDGNGDHAIDVGGDSKRGGVGGGGVGGGVGGGGSGSGGVSESSHSPLFRYTLSHCLVAHKEEKELPEDRSGLELLPEHWGQAPDYERLPEIYRHVIANEILGEGERLRWVETPRFWQYTRTQWIALLCILVPVLVFGVIFYVDSDSPFALVGAVLVWLIIVFMFVLRWWCNVFETPMACYVLTDLRALILRFPHGKKEVISVTYFEMRSKSGSSNVSYYQHWDRTGSCILAELPDFGRIGFARVRDFEKCRSILEKETQGARPRAAPPILKKAFIAQLLRENEKPEDVAGLTVAEADARRSRRALAIVKEQERRRRLGVRGPTAAYAHLRSNRNSPLSGGNNPVIRRESAMSSFTLGGGDTETDGGSMGGATPRGQMQLGRGRGRGRGMYGVGRGRGRGRGGVRPAIPSGLNPNRPRDASDVRIDMPSLRGKERAEPPPPHVRTGSRRAYNHDDSYSSTESLERGGAATSRSGPSRSTSRSDSSSGREKWDSARRDVGALSD